jgi:ATP-dependent Lon protease
LIQSLKKAEVNNPLILLDEIDKIGMDYRGDPASALLEALDPEQNHTFTDHYLDIPFDLSKVFFITTANTLDTIPGALRDRLEVIEMSSYSRREKLEITKRHLLPKLVREHGLKPENLILPEKGLETVLDSYTREAGVRNFYRELAHLMRATAEKIAKNPSHPPLYFDDGKIESVLGPAKFQNEKIREKNNAGVVNGLAWTPTGGEILFIEATRMEGRGKLILTGQLGKIMKESAQIALSVVRHELKESASFSLSDFHIHVPSGSVPKDGPSAGVAMAVALTSLMGNFPVRLDLAFTGELTLRGEILPVGGIKEKVLAAHRSGIKKVCLPRKNFADSREIPKEVKNEMEFYWVETFAEVLSIAGMGDKTLPRFVQNFSLDLKDQRQIEFF